MSYKYKRNTPWKEHGPRKQAHNIWSALGVCTKVNKVKFEIIEMDESWKSRPDIFRYKVYINDYYIGTYKTFKEAQHAALNP